MSKDSTSKVKNLKSAINLGIVDGIILWGVAAATVRMTPESFWNGVTKQKVGVMATAPLLAYVTTKVVKTIHGWTGAEVFAGITAATVAALYLDGLAHAFTPNLYSPNRAVTTGGAGWIFFGAALFISEGYRNLDE
jgi:hypothetical protein